MSTPTLAEARANLDAALKAYDEATASGVWEAIDTADMNLTIATEQLRQVRDAARRAQAPQQKKYNVFLFVDQRGVVATLEGGGQPEREVVIGTSYDAYVALCNDAVAERIMCSSSMDFPQEATSDPAVYALCDRINNE